jgi:hypothetical protein
MRYEFILISLAFALIGIWYVRYPTSVARLKAFPYIRGGEPSPVGLILIQLSGAFCLVNAVLMLVGVIP